MAPRIALTISRIGQLGAARGGNFRAGAEMSAVESTLNLVGHGRQSFPL
jgi:hypothetical protein